MLSRSMPASASPVLDAEQAAFIATGVSIAAASGRPACLPTMARGTGCRVSDDRRRVTVLFAATPAAALLDDVRRSGVIAVVFSWPATHRTLQVKGSDARIVPLESADPALAARYVEAFVAGLEPFGFAPALIRAFLAAPADDLVAVQFTPVAGFNQTPGPQAGVSLRSGA
jgi:hypothetical protein